MIYYLIPPPLLLLLYMDQKLPGLKKLNLYKKGSLPYKKEILVQGGEILLEIYYWTLWMTLQCDLQFSLTIFLTPQNRHDTLRMTQGTPWERVGGD